MSSNTDKSNSKLYEMTVKGREYRKEITVDYLGKEVPVTIRPLVDDEFLPLTARMQESTGFDQEEALEEIENAGDVDEANLDEEEMMDMSDVDDEFVSIMKEASKLGIDGDAMGHTQDEIDEMVDNMLGGLSLEIGGLILELSGEVEDAKQFR